MIIESYGLTDPGCVRDENQDRVLIEPELGLWGVFDGMGGHQNGGMAAELAIDALRYYLQASVDPFDVTWPFGYTYSLSADANRLATAMLLANRQVWRRAEQELQCAGMGTTIAVVLINGSRCVVGNVGDSRVYRFRGGELAQLTFDDTMVHSMVERGYLTPEEAERHPMRNVLTQAAGSQESNDPHIREEDLASGDVLLVTSDGLHGVVQHEAIRAALARDNGLAACAASLVETARAAGGPDNISVVVLRCG